MRFSYTVSTEMCGCLGWGKGVQAVLQAGEVVGKHLLTGRGEVGAQLRNAGGLVPYATGKLVSVFPDPI